MAIGGFDHLGSVPGERVRDVVSQLVLLFYGEQPIAIDPQHQRGRGNGSEHLTETSSVSGDIVGVHCFGEGDVGISIKTPREFVAVKIEVTLHGESTFVSQW